MGGYKRYGRSSNLSGAGRPLRSTCSKTIEVRRSIQRASVAVKAGARRPDRSYGGLPTSTVRSPPRAVVERGWRERARSVELSCCLNSALVVCHSLGRRWYNPGPAVCFSGACLLLRTPPRRRHYLVLFLSVPVSMSQRIALRRRGGRSTHRMF